MRLLEDAQYAVELCIHLPVQQWYLYDDALVRQTVDKLVGNAMGHPLAVIASRFGLYIEHRLLDVAHAVA